MESKELSNLEIVVYHEAAHTVADARLGFTPRKVTVRPNLAAGTAGSAVAHDGWKSQEEGERYLITLYAGYAAELHLHVDPELGRAHANDDFYLAIDPLSKLKVEEATFIAKALDFVRQPKNWAAICLVARDLLVRLELHGDEVELLVAISDGDREAERALASLRRLIDTVPPPEA